MSDLHSDREVRAAEYVLGLMYVSEARAVEQDAQDDVLLAQAIARWEERLAPLASAILPVAPPPDLWNRIEKDLPGERLSAEAATAEAAAPVTQAAATPLSILPAMFSEPRKPAPAPTPAAPLPPPSRRSLWANTGFWRSSTAGGFALAAALAFLLLMQPPLPTQYHGAILPIAQPAATWMAETMPDGRIKLTAMTPIAHPSDRELELWALPKGETKPIPMGLVPDSGVMMVAGHDLKMEGLQLLISLEPRGGSPTGAPTGPVLYGGTMSEVNRS